MSAGPVARHRIAVAVGHDDLQRRREDGSHRCCWLDSPLTATVAGAPATTVRSNPAPIPVQPLASVAVTTNEESPATVGVPERVPSGFDVRPLGSAPELTANVTAPTPPDAVKVSP